MKRSSLILLGASLAVAFLLFLLSANLWGPWWRGENLPTAEEWSAFFGVGVLIALAFTWRQIRQVDESNRLLIESNKVTKQVNIESIRPRIQVYLQSERFVGKNRGAPVEGTVYIALVNSGRSTARNVRLTVSPAFDSLPEFFVQASTEIKNQHFDEVNQAFDGSVRFDTIRPDAKYIWFLGRAPALFKDEGCVPRRYEIHAIYDSEIEDARYEEDFIIDLDVEKRIEAPVDKLVRIGKDIEVIGDRLKDIKSSIPKTLQLDVTELSKQTAGVADGESTPSLNSPELHAQLEDFFGIRFSNDSAAPEQSGT